MRGIIVVLLSIGFLTLLAADVHSQCYTGPCDSLLQADTSGSGYGIVVLLPDSTFDIQNQKNIDEYCAGFRYEYASDSSHVYWAFSEFLINRRKMYLSNWCANRVLNFDSAAHVPVATWTPIELNNRSTTRTVSITGGDTLQFFREMWLATLGSSATAYNYYQNAHALSYSVELVDSATGRRVMLLDTTGYSVTTASRKPCIYSWYPMFARVRVVVQSSIGAFKGYVRINTYAAGANPDPWVRVDNFRPFLSHKWLAKPSILEYNNNVEQNLDCSTTISCDVSCLGIAGPPRISITQQSPLTSSSVALYTLYGSEIWSSTLPMTSNPISVSVPQSGLYIVVCRSGSAVVCTSKVFVP